MQQRTRQSGPTIAESGFRTFENIADRWRLTTKEREAILGISRSTYARQRADPAPGGLDSKAGMGRLEVITHGDPPLTATFS